MKNIVIAYILVLLIATLMTLPLAIIDVNENTGPINVYILFVYIPTLLAFAYLLINHDKDKKKDMAMLQRLSKMKGITLVELLLIIAIAVIIITIVYSSYCSTL